MSVVTVSMKRHPKGNIFDYLGNDNSGRLKGLTFYGLFNHPEAPMEDGQGSICVYTLSRTLNKRTYHARLHDKNKDKVAELLYTLPTGEYEIFLTAGFQNENLFIRFGTQLCEDEQD
jgi:hypothetical protein